MPGQGGVPRGQEGPPGGSWADEGAGNAAGLPAGLTGVKLLGSWIWGLSGVQSQAWEPCAWCSGHMQGVNHQQHGMGASEGAWPNLRSSNAGLPAGHRWAYTYLAVMC